MTNNEESTDSEPSVSSKASLKGEIDQAKDELKEFGGVAAIRSGEWFIALVQKCFRAYYDKANCDYFRSKYPNADSDGLIAKLTAVAAKNASIVGGIVGLAVSADELSSIVTAPATAGLALPAQVAIAVTAIGAELLVVTKIQLKLLAEIAKILGTPLDPDDPEDILTIFAFAMGGGAAEIAGKFGMKVGARATEAAIKATIKKETLATLKRIANKVGLRLLQRNIIKYSVPVVSVAIGAGWNYRSTTTVAKTATKHFKERSKRSPSAS